MSPTQRTMKELKKLGAVVGIVEKWNPHVKIRQDLFGCLDLIALLGPNCIGIQATSNNGGNHAAHLAKIKAEPRAIAWLEAGCLLELWSWSKQGAKGKRKTWTVRREEIVLADLAAPVPRR